jgi:hypothetical protein
MLSILIHPHTYVYAGNHLRAWVVPPGATDADGETVKYRWEHFKPNGNQVNYTRKELDWVFDYQTQHDVLGQHTLKVYAMDPWSADNCSTGCSPYNTYYFWVTEP